MGNLEALLSPKKAADVLGQDVWWVRKRIERRTIPFVKLGGRVYIPADELRRYIAGLPGVTAAQALQSLSGPRSHDAILR